MTREEAKNISVLAADLYQNTNAALLANLAELVEPYDAVIVRKALNERKRYDKFLQTSEIMTLIEGYTARQNILNRQLEAKRQADAKAAARRRELSARDTSDQVQKEAYAQLSDAQILEFSERIFAQLPQSKAFLERSRCKDTGMLARMIVQKAIEDGVIRLDQIAIPA